MNDPEFSKVTIIIETSENRQVILVPQAQRIEFGPVHAAPHSLTSPYSTERPKPVIPQALTFEPIGNEDGIAYYVKSGERHEFASLTELNHEVLDIRYEYAAYSGREYHPESEGESRPSGTDWKVLYRRVGAPYWDIFTPDAGNYAVASRIVASMTQFEIEKARERKEKADA